MSRTVDNRVVQMQFDNSQFEKNVTKSLSTLQKLENSLKFQNGTKGLENVEKAANRVNFNKMNDSIEQSGIHFSKFEIMATTALANITNSVVNLGKRIAYNLISPITSGGLTRALNLEQANFQLEGLGIDKTNNASSSYDEVMNAVLGTAYSYDVAAKAASQLAASNIGVTESQKTLLNGTKVTTKYMTKDMTSAILGIAGVASMTGSSFEDISEVFTRVAGQGRLMSNDLNSIAARGLNAAATLAKYLGVSEAEVRDMVTKGKIDFQTFSDAMTQAFGAHAKDSTKTFTGALEDVKAALSRIGADFYGPGLEATKNMLNALTPLVDLIHDKIQGALNSTANLMKVVSDRIVAFTNIITFSGTALKKQSGAFDTTFSIMANGLKTLKESDIKTLGPIFEKFGIDTSKSFKSIRSELSKSKISFSDFTKSLRDASKSAGEDGVKITDYLSSLTLEVKRLEKVGDAFNLTGSIVQKGFKMFEEASKGAINANDIYSIVAEEMGISTDKLKKKVSDGKISITEFREALESYAAKGGIDLSLVDSVLDKMDEMLLSSPKLNAILKQSQIIFEGLGSAIKIVKDILGGAIKIILDILVALSPLGKLLLNILSYLAQGITKLEQSNTVGKATESVVKGIESALKACAPALKIFSKGFDILKSILEDAGAAFKKFLGFLHESTGEIAKMIGPTIISMIQALAKSVQFLFQAFSTAGISVILANLFKLNALLHSGDFLGKEAFTGLSKGIIDTVEIVKTATKELLNNINSVVKTKTQVSLIKAVGTAILEIAAAMFLLSTIEPSRLMASVSAVTSSLLLIVGTMKVMSGGSFSSKGLNNISKLTTGMITISTSILIIATALKKVSGMSPKEMAVSISAISILMVGITLMTKQLTYVSKFGSGKKQMISGLTSLIAVAISIRILADALIKIGELSTTDIIKGTGALAAIFGVVELMTVIMKKSNITGADGKAMTKMAISFISIGLAIKILASSVEELGSLDIGSLAKGLGSIIIMMGTLSASVLLLSKGNSSLSAAIALISLATGIKIMSGAIQTLGALDIASLAKGLGSIIIMLGVVSGAMVLMSATGGAASMLAFSVGFVVLASGLSIFADVLKKIGSMKLSTLAKSFITLTLAIGALVVLSPLLLLAGAALLVFGSGVAVLGGGIALLGIGLASISTSLTVFTANISVIPQLVESMVIGMLQGLAKGSNDLIKIVSDTIIGVLKELTENMPVLVDLLLTTIEQLLISIAEHAEKFVEIGFTIIANMIKGLADGLPLLLDAGFNLIISMIDGLANAIEKNVGRLGKAISHLIYSIGKALGSIIGTGAKAGIDLIRGLMDGLGDALSLNNLWKKVKNFGKKVLDKLKHALGINSPSKETKWQAKMILEGYIEGFKTFSNKTTDAAKKTGNKILGALKTSINNDSNINSSLKLTPVMDDKSFSNLSSMNLPINMNAINKASSGFVSEESKWNKLINTLQSTIKNENNIDYNKLELAFESAVSNLNLGISLDGREFGRGLKDMGVKFDV